MFIRGIKKGIFLSHHFEQGIDIVEKTYLYTLFAFIMLLIVHAYNDPYGKAKKGTLLLTNCSNLLQSISSQTSISVRDRISL